MYIHAHTCTKYITRLLPRERVIALKVVKILDPIGSCRVLHKIARACVRCVLSRKRATLDRNTNYLSFPKQRFTTYLLSFHPRFNIGVERREERNFFHFSSFLFNNKFIFSIRRFIRKWLPSRNLMTRTKDRCKRKLSRNNFDREDRWTFPWLVDTGNDVVCTLKCETGNRRMIIPHLLCRG